jgi:uncharacterized membrane protein
MRAPSMRLHEERSPTADSRIHLVATGFIERDDAVRALKAVQWLTEHDHLELEGHALITRDTDGDVRIEESKDADPGPLRGGFVGGAAGALLEIATGPIGAAAVIGGAVIGAIATGMHDAGFPDVELRAIGDLMANGRTILLLGVEPACAARLDAASDEAPEFANVTYRQVSELADSDALGEAIREYRRAQTQPEG